LFSTLLRLSTVLLSPNTSPVSSPSTRTSLKVSVLSDKPYDYYLSKFNGPVLFVTTKSIVMASQTSISKHTMCRLRKTLLDDQKPSGLLDNLIKDVKMGVEYSTVLKQRTFLSTCLKLRLCPPEILSLASRLGARCVTASQGPTTEPGPVTRPRDREEEKRILKKRIASAAKEAKVKKEKWGETSKATYRATRLSKGACREFKNIKEAELAEVWKNLTAKYNKKVDNLVASQRPAGVTVPDSHKGVLVSDRLLSEEFGDEDPEPRIYGGIEATQSMRKFLMLPANFRRYPKVNIINETVNAEVAAAKQRWSARDLEVEEDTTPEATKTRKDKESKDRKVANGKAVSFAKQRPTDLRHCKSTTMPKAADMRTEIKIQNQRLESLETIRDFIHENCDEEGNVKDGENLTYDELIGLKEIQAGIKDQDWMLYVSDKSNFMVLDTKINFLMCMKKHYEGDDVASMDAIKEAETTINHTARIWTNILRIGHDTGQAVRCRGSLISEFSTIPVLQGYRKDHKADMQGSKEQGPPLRPLCAANRALNAPLGDLMSDILKAVGDEISTDSGTELRSTEELCRALEDANVAIKELHTNMTSTTTTGTTQGEMECECVCNNGTTPPTYQPATLPAVSSETDTTGANNVENVPGTTPTPGTTGTTTQEGREGVCGCNNGTTPPPSQPPHPPAGYPSNTTTTTQDNNATVVTCVTNAPRTTTISGDTYTTTREGECECNNGTTPPPSQPPHNPTDSCDGTETETATNTCDTQNTTRARLPRKCKVPQQQSRQQRQPNPTTSQRKQKVRTNTNTNTTNTNTATTATTNTNTTNTNDTNPPTEALNNMDPAAEAPRTDPTQVQPTQPHVTCPLHQPMQGWDVYVGGMDVSAMYPSILKDMAGPAAAGAIRDSKMDWDVDQKVVMRYLGLTIPRNEIEALGLGEIVPTPRHSTTLRSYANPQGKAKQANGDNQFSHVRTKPTTDQVKSALGLAASKTIQLCMNSHFYRIGEEIRRQRDGGSIGSAMAGEASRVYMLGWDKDFIHKVKALGLSLLLYARYVDDITLVCRNIHQCWSYDPINNRMVYNNTTVESGITDEQHTFNVLQAIANSIHPQIQLTLDIPGNHTDGRMPVLDLKIWVHKDSLGLHTIHHTFYKKPVSSPYTILNTSAMSMAVKRETHFQEALRRMKNVDPAQPWEEKARHLSEWTNMLRISGYGPKYRFRILSGAITRHLQLLEDVKEKKIPSLYRTRAEMIRAKETKGGGSTAATWFLKGGVTGTLEVTSTPKSALAGILTKLLKVVTSPTGGRTKVVEGGGVPITRGLKLGNPFRKDGCAFKDPNCRVSPKVDCGKMGAVYAVTCDICGDVEPTGPQGYTPTTASTTPSAEAPQTNHEAATTTVDPAWNQIPNTGSIHVFSQQLSQDEGAQQGPGQPHQSLASGGATARPGPVQDNQHQGPTQTIQALITTNRARNQQQGATLTAGSRTNTQKNNRGKTKGGPKGPPKLPRVFKDFDQRPHYLGQTARSLHMRMSEHQTQMMRGDQKNAMARHTKNCHSTDQVQPTFTMHLVCSHNKNVVRQTSEGIHLERQDPGLSWNDRMEWGRNRGPVRFKLTNV
jgi:hypothetical protein